MITNLNLSPRRNSKQIIKYLIAIISAYILLSSLTSCVLTKKQKDRFCAKCTLSNTIKDSISVKDSVAQKISDKTYTITIHDTLRYSAPNPCADLCDSLGRLKKGFAKEIKSNNGTRLKVFEENGELKFHNLIDSLKKVISIKDTSLTYYKKTERFRTETSQVPARCEKPHFRKIDTFLVISGGFLWLIILSITLYLVIRFYLKSRLKP